jgi:hypothetical protein
LFQLEDNIRVRKMASDSKNSIDPTLDKKGGSRLQVDRVDFGAVLASSEIASTLERTQVAKFHTKGGAGFAAEEANALKDHLSGSTVEMTGLANELNGADRIVDGIPIQTKYFDNARATVEAAFDSTTGQYRYGSQLLEVPRDQYPECLSVMRDKIAAGKVPNITNPSEAESLIRQGSVTYRQARNIARTGNIDSLAYDAQTQAVTTGCVFTISFLLEFGHRAWSGEDIKMAARNAATSALSSGAKSFVTGVAAAQVLRTRAAAGGTVVMRSGVKVIHTTEAGKAMVRQIASASLRKSVSGVAALNHVSKLLRSNVITSSIATVVVTGPDFYRAAVSRSISWPQFTKNLCTNIGGVGGATGGWFAGAAAGATLGSAVPVVGTAIGGVVGGIVGGLAGGIGGSALAKAGADLIADDDAKHLSNVIQQAVGDVAHDYLLTAKEVSTLTKAVKATVTSNWLKQMHKAGAWSSEKNACYGFAYSAFEKKCEKIVESRPRISVPSPEEIAGAPEGILQASPRRRRKGRSKRSDIQHASNKQLTSDPKT